MNDINKSLDQNIVLPKQLHYIIFLRNELNKLAYLEIINAKYSEYVKNIKNEKRKTNEMLYFRYPYFLIRKLYM